MLYAPTRVVQEANPDWRLVSWALALEVVVLTLAAGSWWRANAGARFGPLTRREAFPVLFFLVAVPWPTLLEAPVVQALSRANATAAVELLGWLGVPALCHGNVLEVDAGLVGIDDACSGVRSLQATVMIALFFGEVYRRFIRRRLLCVAAGILCAFAFNVARTTLLSWVAARSGLPAMERWHDPAGVAVLMGCFVAVWAMTAWGPVNQLRPVNQSTSRPVDQLTSRPLRPVNRLSRLGAIQWFTGLQVNWSTGLQVYRFTGSLALLLWLLVVELGTEAHYRLHERSLPEPVRWSIALPRDNPTLRESPLAERTRQLLRFDQASNATWENGAGRWQAIYLRWKPGRTAAGLARAHLPEVCLTATGHELVSESGLQRVSAAGLELPVKVYRFQGEAGQLDVLYCLWEERSTGDVFGSESLTWRRRLQCALAGRRNTGQCSLELALWGGEEGAERELMQAVKRFVRRDM